MRRGALSGSLVLSKGELLPGARVLNATYEPLCVVPLRRAVVLVLAEKAVIVEAAGQVLHSERVSIPAPSVVRLSRYVRVPYRRAVPLTRPGSTGAKVTVPTTLVWSDRGVALGPWAAEHTAEWVDAPYRLVVLPGVSHWIPTQAPDQLAEAILERVRSSPGR